MKKNLTLFTLLLFAFIVKAQQKDTLEVQKIGDKFYVIVDHSKTDSTIQAAVKTATVPKRHDSHFMVAGLGTLGFAHTWTTTNSKLNPSQNSKNIMTNSFGNDPQFEFSPMFLWRHSDKLLVEFEPSFDGSILEVNWACVSYFVHPGVILRAGFLTLPFGTYNKRLAAGWINKLATDPVGVTGSPASSDWGIEVEGGLPVGNMKVSYDVALANGFQLVEADGSIQNPGITDNNLGKTVSGRFGWLPLKNSGLEFGVSGLYGKAADANSLYKNASTFMGAFDAQYIYSGPHAVINLKGQYNMGYVTKENYVNPNDSTQTYTYDNVSMGYYGLFSVRPVSPSKFLRNLEFAARYSAYDTPKNSTWENHTQQITAGVAYWLNWRTVFKITYENLMSSNPANAVVGTDIKTTQNILFAQFAVEF